MKPALHEIQIKFFIIFFTKMTYHIKELVYAVKYA
jgi:hypothetical protein